METGPWSTLGEKKKQGLELALQELPDINGKKIELIYEDTKGENKNAISAVNKFISVDKVNFIIGAIASWETLAVAPIIEEHKVVYLAPGSNAPKITQSGDYIFRTKVSSVVESQALSAILYDNYNVSTLAIIAINNDYGVGVAESLKNDFEKLGGTILLTELYEDRLLDFKTTLIKLKSQNPEAIFLVGGDDHIGHILKQAKELGIQSLFVTHPASVGPQVQNIAGNAAEGILLASEYDLTSLEPAVMDFRKKFNEKYGKDPDLFPPLSYDALHILADGIEQCEENSECVKDYLYTVQDYHGAVGITSFDENGDVQRPFVVMTMKNGEFQKVK